MAVFAGTGSLIFGGQNHKALDLQFVGLGGLVADGVWEMDIEGCYFGFGSGGLTLDNGTMAVRISRNYFGNSLTVTGNSLNNIVADNTFDAEIGIVLDAAQRLVVNGNTASGVLIAGTTTGPLTLVGNEVYNLGEYVIDVEIDATNPVTISDNTIYRGSIRVDGSDIGGQTNVAITDNTIRDPSEHGIHLIFADRATISGNNVASEAGNTIDGIIVEDSDGVMVEHNQVTVLGVGALRYGINIAGGDDNIVVGNNLGAAADYGTAPIGDSGTGTILDYPSDATWGDNFVS